MGWNTGYTIFEATVMGAYALGTLDKALLSVLMAPYRDTDIDSGGSQGLTSADGKRVEQIVIETWGLAMPPTPQGTSKAAPAAWDRYNEEVDGLFASVTDHFGWS